MLRFNVTHGISVDFFMASAISRANIVFMRCSPHPDVVTATLGNLSAKLSSAQQPHPYIAACFWIKTDRKTNSQIDGYFTQRFSGTNGCASEKHFLRSWIREMEPEDICLSHHSRYGLIPKHLRDRCWSRSSLLKIWLRNFSFIKKVATGHLD